MYDVPQLIPRSPQSTRSQVSSTPTRQSPMRLLSPSKARATPSKTRQISPRKSPAKGRLFHATSTKPVSFTPEKTKQPPRAWERRPATPFIPRDDKQKIWKRVPLGEIGIEPNRPANISRKEQEATKDYVRVVKKLKVGHGSDDEDKENVSAGVKLDVEDKDPKRRVRFDSRFVTMKTEEDVILGSPKKKLRTVTNTNIPHTEEEMKEAASEEGGGSADGGEAMHNSHQVTDERQDGQDERGTSDHESSSSSDAELVAETTNVLPQEHSNGNDLASEQAPSYASHCEMLTAEVHGPGGALNNALSDETDVQVAVADTLQMETLSEQASNSTEHESSKPADLNDQELPAQSTELDESLNTSEQPSTEMEDNAAESPVSMPEEPRSSSPPTILAENVIIDELESRNMSRLDASATEENIPSDNSTEAQDGEGVRSQEPISRRISDDEATFLRNFVSASKAERAARERKMQEMASDESGDQQGDTPQPQAEDQGSHEETAHVVDEIPKLERPTEVSIENVTSSPLRRSKRAVITSIPRPQTLPNAIQLKRANGNEFIFTANKASSMVNVAVVTRSNTKRNKGSALNVPERLEQLSAGEEAGEQPQAVGDAGEASDKSALDSTYDKAETRKRKREAKDGGVRAKKVLRWNDEKLVSYQEAERNVDGWEDIDDSSQENSTPYDRETGDPDKHVKLTLTMVSNGSNSTQGSASTKEPVTSSKSSTKDHKESSTLTPSSSQNKLRRVRRGTSGTVNGTPGPKTRSRRVAEDDEKDVIMDVPADTNGSVEDSTAVVAAITELAATTEAVKGNSAATSKKSRMPMPVPVASGLSSRRGATASASIRGTGVGRVGAATAGAGAGDVKRVKEASKSQVQTQPSKDDGKGDLLGKRRLRVRP